MSLRLRELVLLENFNLLAFLLYKIKFLLRFFLTRAKIWKSPRELKLEELVSGTLFLILGS